jgi:N-acetylneuraminate synthase
MARGASVIEAHVIFDRRMFAPDNAASITFDELALLVRARNAFVAMDSSPVDKNIMAESLGSMRVAFGKSLAPIRAFPAGTILDTAMLAVKKPGGGIPPEAAEQIYGRRLARDVTPDRILRWEDLKEGK